MDPIRARRIVKLAASRTVCAREWLTRDERGTWEKAAIELWEKTAPARAEMKLSDERSESEIADHLALLALEAMLRDAKKREGR